MSRKLYSDELAARYEPGEPYRPSNGTEGMSFDEMWCNECERDARYRRNPEAGGGCSILCRSLLYEIGDEKYPKEWTHGLGGQPMCTAFRPEGTRKNPPKRRPAPLFDALKTGTEKELKKP